MELRQFILQPNMTKLFPPFTACCVNNKLNKPYFQDNPHHHQKKDLSLKISKRVVGVLGLAALVLIPESAAVAIEFVAPDQTAEEAQSGIRGHAEELLQVKGLLEAESWRAAQKALRLSSSRLKKDIYTIIQNKPGIERPQLRKLYTILFTNVTRLDYAARDKDIPEIWQRYENIVAAINDILSRI